MQAFSAIPIFIAVVENGSFSSAASQLNITKSAISKRITQLEEELGIRLLNRTTRKLSLTEAGSRYYEYVVQSFNLAQQGVDAVTELQGSPRGRLKVTTPMTFGVLHVAPLISEFLKQYPDVTIDLQLEDKMVDLVEQGFDVGIRIGQLAESNLVAKRLAPCVSVLCASPEYLATHDTIVTPRDLINHNCLLYSYYRGGTEWSLTQHHQEHRVVPSGSLRVNNSEALRKASLGGAGIANLPTFIVANDLLEGRLVHVLADYQLPQHAVYAVFPERKHMPLKVRAFIDFIADKLGTDTPYWDKGLKLSQ